MKQYFEIKAKYPDAILLFRVGDFYETFCDDAIKTSEILGITLTRRANGSAASIELAGFPHHALDTYLPKLIRAGQRVAVCDQLEDPKTTKKIVKRGVTELVTPGVSTSDNVLNHKENNFLASVHFSKKTIGVAFLDFSTGEFLIAEGNADYIDKLIGNFSPKEIIYERSRRDDFVNIFGGKHYTFELEDWVYESSSAEERLLRHFSTKNLKGYGVSSLPVATCAAGAILHYLDITQHKNIGNITTLGRIEEDRYVWLDRFTIRNLELFSSNFEGGTSLCSVLDSTISPMGSRLLKRWISFPLKDVEPIRTRHSIVEFFTQNENFAEHIASQIMLIGDMERIISKVATGRITPRESVQLKIALKAIVPIKESCNQSKNDGLRSIADRLNPCKDIVSRIEQTLKAEPAAQINKGGVIADGFNAELDDLREVAFNAKDILAKMLAREKEATGIDSLKVGFNNVFGYYLEVRNTHKDKVPIEWTRKQTLTSGERYITEELKELETKIQGAEERILILETRLYTELVLGLAEYMAAVQVNANLIAQLDCLHSLANVAIRNQYSKPEISDDDALNIKDGRHPVIEKQLPEGEPYISNDVYLDSKEQQIMIITGPNMSGKSALLRQTALITLMAQIGSFVPAKEAHIGIVDKIFTRVGASDNISQGESTFMVEMNEAASILNNISHRSLILFDELGRGTSTYDGISIAWSIVEYIHEHRKAKAKTLFATHYHELNEMEKSFPRVKNFNVSIKEVDNKVIFMRKLKAGGSEHSFGIHVARMAGMPPSVVHRANQVLEDLERGRNDQSSISKPVEEIADSREGMQLSFFQLDDPVLEQIRDEITGIDINNLTPMEALNKLNDIKKHLGN